MDFSIIKYPRTPHLEGSRLQDGDHDLSQVPFAKILGKNIVIEEKIDGANCAISFNDKGELLIQSRGHYLVGGSRERDYALLKQWANEHAVELYLALGSRYVMYGEWMYIKHAIFYDTLPSYFMEFDIFDRTLDVFLDTDNRKKITDNLPFIRSVPVLAKGVFKTKKQILDYLSTSKYISENYRQNLLFCAQKSGVNINDNDIQTDRTMEGLYIKIEENGTVTERVKYVRASYKQAQQSQTDWFTSKHILNMLDENCEF